MFYLLSRLWDVSLWSMLDSFPVWNIGRSFPLPALASSSHRYVYIILTRIFFLVILSLKFKILIRFIFYSLLRSDCTSLLCILDLRYPANPRRQKIPNFSRRTYLRLHSTLYWRRLHLFGLSRHGPSLNFRLLREATKSVKTTNLISEIF